MTVLALFLTAKVLGLSFPIYDVISLFAIHEFLSWLRGEPIFSFLREEEE